MVTIALSERILAGRGAVRVHGGGFGGTAQAFVPPGPAGGIQDADRGSAGRRQLPRALHPPRGRHPDRVRRKRP